MIACVNANVLENARVRFSKIAETMTALALQVHSRVSPPGCLLLSPRPRLTCRKTRNTIPREAPMPRAIVAITLLCVCATTGYDSFKRSQEIHWRLHANLPSGHSRDWTLGGTPCKFAATATADESSPSADRRGQTVPQSGTS